MFEPEYDELESEDADMTAGLSLVDQLIVDTAREVGASTVRKWVVSTPASRNLKLEPKRKHEASSSQRHAPAKTKASSSKKRKVIVVSDSDDEDPVISITVYVLIPKKAPSIVSKVRGKPPPSEILQKGPFGILSTDSYPQFLSKFAAALPCLPKHIRESKIEWKPKKPLNAPTLPSQAPRRFRPGDTTEPKPDDEVKQVGFALFSWRRIHEANVRFKAELAGGKFV
ncbi:hypothetical protein B0H16DRAFT_1857035 [Mycena metata]|uniref:Uncharacterized protein n=1 Tax=Mycena metata TaxID=1033252 RepID=A0AAD7ILF5_9AGAR|nr:hypothetical protein B0H16DRAFT_1857035 [Mycena metata]